MCATFSEPGRSSRSASRVMVSNATRPFSHTSLTRFGKRSRLLDDGLMLPAARSRLAASFDGTDAMNAQAASAAARVH